MNQRMKLSNRIWSIVMTIVCVIYMYPIFMVLTNSLKVESAISTGTAFELPNAETFAGLANYENAINAQGFLSSFFYTTFITVSSVLAILLFCSMFAWYITRVNNLFTRILYLLCAFSMVVPFQMVMFTLSNMADTCIWTRRGYCGSSIWVLAQAWRCLCSVGLCEACRSTWRRLP